MAQTSGVKLLKEITPNQPSSVLVRVASVQPITLCKTGSYRLSFEVIDEQNTRARVVFYGKTKDVCDRYEQQMKVNCVIRMERFTVKSIPAQYRISDFQYEIQLTCYSRITPAAENEARVIPPVKFTYIPIGAIADCPIGSLISCVVYVKNVGEVVVDNQQSTARVTREIKVADQFNDEIVLTLWNERAKNCILKDKMIIAICRGKVSSYQGLSLQANSGTEIMTENVDEDEAKKLHPIVNSKKRNVGESEDDETHSPKKGRQH